LYGPPCIFDSAEIQVKFQSLTMYMPPCKPLWILLHLTIGLLFVRICIPASALSKGKDGIYIKSSFLSM
jgi:hypothetical protein